MRYERSSPIARHFLSLKFWRFEMKSEFFNTHGRYHSLTLGMESFGCNRDLLPTVFRNNSRQYNASESRKPKRLKCMFRIGTSLLLAFSSSCLWAGCAPDYRGDKNSGIFVQDFIVNGTTSLDSGILDKIRGKLIGA